MTQVHPKIISIQGTVKNYPWGSYTTLAQHRGESQSDQPEAELWFGDHPAGPAQIPGSAATLDQITQSFGSLPFLAKILAVEHSLSLQVHPALEDIPNLSSVLKDANHKPEMVVALSDFHALVGLAPIESVLTLLNRLGSAKVDALIANPLRAGVSSVQILDRLLGVEDTLGVLDEVLGNIGNLESHHQRWLRELIELYAPKLDPLALVLCELVVLKPGESIYLPPRCIHAYLHGTVVEVMASSDNVIRGGLTNKPIDKENFLALVDLQAGKASRLEPQGSEKSPRWIPPIDDFALQKLDGEINTTIHIDEHAIAFTWTGSAEISPEGAALDDGDRVVVSGNLGALLAPGTYLVVGRASLWVVTGKGR